MGGAQRSSKACHRKEYFYQPPALYNLATDIAEGQNLAAAQPVEVASLNNLYTQWSKELISPLWMGTSSGSAATLAKLTLAGDWNAFNKDDSSPPWQLTLINAPDPNGTPDGFEWLVNTIHVAATGGDTSPGVHSFTLVANGSYLNQWGGVTVNIDSTTLIPSVSASVLGPSNNISLEDGYWYSFRIINHMHIDDPLTIAVMKTSAPPVTVGQIEQTPVTPAPDEPVVVSFLTNQVKSAEERIYLRWSTDFFITSHIVEATGSGMNYSATIPPQPAGTALQYRIVTSTTDLSSFVASGSIDSLTLSTSSTFKFVVGGDTEPTPTPTHTYSNAYAYSVPRRHATPALSGLTYNGGIAFVNGTNLISGRSYTVTAQANTNTQSVVFSRDGAVERRIRRLLLISRGRQPR